MVASMLAVVTAVRPARAQCKDASEACYYYDDKSCTPLKPVEKKLWGELQPVDPVPLPPDRDHTTYNTSQFPSGGDNLFDGIDISNGYLFMAGSCEIQIWDLHGTPTRPKRVASLEACGGLNGKSPLWPRWGHAHLWWTQENIAVPADDDNLALVDGESGVGILDTSDKTHPKLLYQDYGGSSGIAKVVVLTMGGRHIGFAGTRDTSNSDGVHPVGVGLGIYDMDAARQIQTTPCLEDPTDATTYPRGSCGKVWLDYVPGPGYYDFAALSGTDHYMASITTARTVLWDMTGVVQSPPTPKKLVTDTTVTGAGGALWHQPGTSRYYLATLSTLGVMRVFDVTKCLASGCSALDAPIATVKSTVQSPDSFGDLSLEYLQSQSAPFLHAYCSGDGGCFDRLFDMSDPAHPRRVGDTRSETIQYTAAGSSQCQKTVDYFSWYYMTRPTGISWYSSRNWRFRGRYLYRALWTALDIHKWTPPTVPGDAGAADGSTPDSGGSAGDAGNGVDAGGVDASRGSATAGDKGSCGCRLGPDAGRKKRAPWLVLFGLIGVVALRRKSERSRT